MPNRSQRPAPLSLRLTRENRLRLERDAAGMSLSSYIQWRLFDPASPPPRSRGKAPVKDHKALAAALAKLGQSRVPNNLNQAVRLAHAGSLVLTPELEAELREAVAYVADIRRLLATALGLMDGTP